jgi:ABC-type dipeptide transport system, periplasmic component
MRRSAPVVGVALAAIVALAGCSAEPAAPTVEIDPDARISVASLAAVTKWDPGLNVGGPEPAFLRMVYDTLVGLDPDNRPIPSLATEWTTDDGGVTYTFTLRDDVTFTDGTEFDADVAVEVLEHYRTVEAGTLKGILSNIDTVEAEDDTTLVITQKTPDVTLPVLLTDRPGMMISPASFAAGPVEKPVGTGPFVWVDEVQTVSLTLDRNDDYWNPDAVKVAGVDVQVMEDPVARFNAIRSGSIDATLIGADQIEEARNLPGLGLYEIKGRAARLITINPDLEPALGDPDVRLALNMAIDREGIAQGVLFGSGEPGDQLRPVGFPGYSEGVEPIPYDPEGARDLLEKAGYGDGLSMVFVTQPRYQKEAEAIQANWAEIGVDIEVQVLPGSGAGVAMWYDKTAAIGLANFDGRQDIGIALRALFLPNQVNNPGNVVDDEVTRLITESSAETDEDARQALFKQIAQKLNEAPLGVWPVVWGYEAVVYTDRVVGFQPYQSGFPVLTGVGIAAAAE